MSYFRTIGNTYWYIYNNQDKIYSITIVSSQDFDKGDVRFKTKEEIKKHDYRFKNTPRKAT